MSFEPDLTWVAIGGALMLAAQLAAEAIVVYLAQRRARRGRKARP